MNAAVEVLPDTVMLALVVGFFSPLVLALINQPGWSARRKALVAFAWSMIVGTVTAWLSGQFSGLSWVSTVLLVLVVTITTYGQFWKPTGAAKAIEEGTSPHGTRGPPSDAS